VSGSVHIFDFRVTVASFISVTSVTGSVHILFDLSARLRLNMWHMAISGRLHSYPWHPATSGWLRSYPWHMHCFHSAQPISTCLYITLGHSHHSAHIIFTYLYIYSWALLSQCTAHFQLHLRLHIWSAFTGIAHFHRLYPWHPATSGRLRSYLWHLPTSVHIRAMCSGFTGHISFLATFAFI